MHQRNLQVIRFLVQTYPELLEPSNEQDGFKTPLHLLFERRVSDIMPVGGHEKAFETLLEIFESIRRHCHGERCSRTDDIALFSRKGS